MTDQDTFTERLNGKQLATLAGLLLAYVVLRLAGIISMPEFEDHDSLAFIRDARTLLSGNFDRIWGMNPDSIIMYPLTVAAVSLVSGDFELAARLVSLLAGLGTSACAFMIARRVAGNWAGIAAVSLIAFNPVFIRLHYSVLTEPLYVAIVVLGAWLFFSWYERLTLGRAALLGVVFGFSFLTRLEGILFLGAIPFLLILYRLAGGNRAGWREVWLQSILYAAVFVAVSAPQVIRVSDNMGTFSLNGRTTWSVLHNAPDDRVYSERFYGLDYDPGMTNLLYLQKHPEVQASFVEDRGFASMVTAYVKTVLLNLEELHHKRLPLFVGIPLLLFAVIGLAALLLGGRVWDGLFLAAFIGIGLVGPLLHNVVLRHIAVLGPFMCVLAAVGIRHVLMEIGRSLPNLQRFAVSGGVVLVLFCLSPLALDVGRVIAKEDDTNGEYTRSVIVAAVEAWQEELRDRGETPVRIVAKKSYFGHFSGAATVLLPHTDLDGLVRFMSLNEAEYLFLETRLAATYPFLDELRRPAEDGRFELLYEAPDRDGGSVLLYRLKP